MISGGLHQFDDFLIDRVFQPASDRLHSLTGWDSVDQARLLWRICGMAWAVCCGWSMAHGNPWQLEAFMALLCISLSFFHSPEEERARWCVRNGMRNSTRLKPVTFWLRILTVPVTVAAQFTSYDGYQTLLLVVLLRDYFSCCDPQGPGNGKIREWIQGLFRPHRTAAAPQEGA